MVGYARCGLVGGAFSIPLTTESGEPFPARAEILFLTFVVVVGTLLIQGVSLPWVIRRLGVSSEEDAAADRLAYAAAQDRASREAESYLDTMARDIDDQDPRQLQVAMLRKWITTQRNTAWEELGRGPEDIGESPTAAGNRMRSKMLAIQRRVFIDERDAEIIELELILADMESLEKRLDNLSKKAKSGDKETLATIELIKPLLELTRDGKPARLYKAKDREEYKRIRQLQLLTSKPAMYVLNVDEGSAATGNAISAKAAEMAKAKGAQSVVISAKIEAEMAGLSDEDKQEFLADLGLKETGLAGIVRAGFSLLDILTFFTVGPKEARAWTVRRGAAAPEAAADEDAA